MKTRIAARSEQEGYDKSRLPEFTEEEKEYINGTCDFLGVNSYSTNMVRAIPEPGIGSPNFYSDIGTQAYQPDDWETSASDWLKVVPWGMRKLLNWVKDTYNNPEIVITENGYSEDKYNLDDQGRISYYQRYLSSVRDAMEDGVNVVGYTAWSLMDNYEWIQGYTQKFGLYGKYTGL
ncbi:hypothetical protein NQ317_010784 [Molorchus minor]|uniref:Beta-glucosidase n=1 Tax=Molorchus minor TaxID=1323400 RepID=A0ABQ9IQI9_9CUCU|nr:hypothetical protein NQ317_010784 [Molorchus minor]